MLKSYAKYGLGLITLLGFAASATSPAIASDERTAKNSVYIEGLGPGMLWSLNYERLVLNDLGVRLGFSYMSFSASAGGVGTSASFFTFPITASYIGVASGSHALELGGGPSLVYVTAAASGFGYNADGSGMTALGNVFVGYRCQPTDGGFQFRVGASGLFGPGLSFSATDSGNFGIIPWFYLSLGGSFGA